MRHDLIEHAKDRIARDGYQSPLVAAVVEEKVIDDLCAEYAIEHLDWPDTPEELDDYLDDLGRDGGAETPDRAAVPQLKVKVDDGA